MTYIIHHPKSTSKSSKGDRAKIQFNEEEKLFTKEREYMKALNYTKLDKLFAKPYLFTLSGHKTGIKQLCNYEQYVCSLSFDNSIFLWDIKNKQQMELLRFNELINGIAISESTIYFTSGRVLYVVDNYKSIEMISREQNTILRSNFKSVKYYKKYNARGHINRILYKNKKLFLATTDGIEDFTNKKFYAKSLNIKHIDDSHDFIAATDGFNLILIDKVLNRIFFQKKIGEKINCVFIKNSIIYSGNGNHNIYKYDVKNNQLTNIVSHIRSVTTVLAVGNLIISGSFDRTIHIRDGDARYIYHTKQMDSINSIIVIDNFILSGSIDGDIRAWKLNINKKMEILSKREEENIKMKNRIQKKFRYVKEIKRIKNHLNVPKKYKEEMKQQFEKNLNKF